jgi:hypothetical protein
LPSHITHPTRDETTGTTTTNRRRGRGRGREILFLQRHETQSASEAMSEGLLSVVESGINNGCDFLRFNRHTPRTPWNIGQSSTGSRGAASFHRVVPKTIPPVGRLLSVAMALTFTFPLDSRRDDSCCLAVASVCQFVLVSTRQGLLQPER